MPSRRVIALILAFWVATSAYIAYRDLWPRLFASGPPPVAIDLADEAAQNVPVRWAVSWNGKPVGRLTTMMSYARADDTFWFTQQYKDLRLEVAGLRVVVPKFVSSVRVTRAGDLREQSAEGELELHLGGAKIAGVSAKLHGTVADGRLTATFEGSYQLAGGPEQKLKRTLDPVDVPAGQPLNPLQPVSRLTGLKPGRRWVVRESDPLREAVTAVVREFAGQYGLKLPEEKDAPLVGEVQSEPQNLDWHGEPVSCWVIEYRRESELAVRTWVRASDGRVLKQEAFHKGETMTIERQD